MFMSSSPCNLIAAVAFDWAGITVGHGNLALVLTLQRVFANRRMAGGNQKIIVDEAIKAWTLDGAYTTFEEKNKGSITPGKMADFVVLQKDPRTVDPDTIKDIV